MKILVLSDTHRMLRNTESVLKRISSKIDCVVHLGDCVNDAETIAAAYPNIRLKNVSGNCDFGSHTPTELAFSIGGVKILITHGHKHNVKWGYDRISYLAEEYEAQAVLFGHTHMPVIDYCNAVLVFNPGSISQPRGDIYPTYGVLDISDGIIHPAIMEIRGDGSFVHKL